MASRSRRGVRLSLATWTERRLPALARMLQTAPVLRGESTRWGTAYRGKGSEAGPLLVVAGTDDFEPRWVASTLASALGAVAVVVPAAGGEAGPGGDPARAGDAPSEGVIPDVQGRIAAAVGAAAALGADPDRLALVGVAAGASTVLTAAGGTVAGSAARLVLLAPTQAPTLDLAGVPPVFLQFSPDSPHLTVGRSLEIDLRESGVAVRPVEYANLPDAWVRYPSLVSGSKRAVDDVVAFLRRGFGMEGTFSGVVPGWDLK